MIPRRRQQPEENVDSWLMSYADMITLLLTFFIIFVSVSEPKKDKLNAIAEGIQNKFGVVDLSTPLQGVFRSLQTVIEAHQILRDVAVEKGETTVAMELAANTFFQPNSAEFKPDQIAVLTDLVTPLKTLDFLNYRITVEGHTSDVPANNPMYPSNWELSSSRADRMVRFFIEQGIKPERLRAIGYADAKPKVPNLDGGGKAIVENREKNQRLLILIDRVP